MYQPSLSAHEFREPFAYPTAPLNSLTCDTTAPITEDQAGILIASPADDVSSVDQNSALSPSASISASSYMRRTSMSKAERRAEHNAIERARRENLNGKFLQLAEALPNLQGRRRPSKGQIVDKALDWVKRCAAKESRYQYHLLQLQRENKRLTAQLNLTRTEASGITPPLPDPSLTSPHPFPRYPTTEDSSAHLWLSSQHTTTATVTGGATAAAAAAAATSVNMMTMNQVTPYPLSRPQWRFDEDYDDDDNSSVLEDPNQFGLTFSHDMSPHPSSYSLDHVYSHDWNNPKDSFHHSLPRYEASMEYSVPLIVHGP